MDRSAHRGTADITQVRVNELGGSKSGLSPLSTRNGRGEHSRHARVPLTVSEGFRLPADDRDVGAGKRESITLKQVPNSTAGGIETKEVVDKLEVSAT